MYSVFTNEINQLCPESIFCTCSGKISISWLECHCVCLLNDSQTSVVSSKWELYCMEGLYGEFWSNQIQFSSIYCGTTYSVSVPTTLIKSSHNHFGKISKSWLTLYITCVFVRLFWSIGQMLLLPSLLYASVNTFEALLLLKMNWSRI